MQDPVGGFQRRRLTELKHGRVSILATKGSITLGFTCKLPSYLSPAAGLKFADIPNGLGALGKVPAAGWAQIVAYSASACCPMTSPIALPRPQATSASRC